MKNLKINAICAATVITLTASTAAWSQAVNPATATFNVNITLAKSCTVVAGPDIALGTQYQGNADVTGNSAFTVTCTKLTPYTIAMTPSNLDTTGAGEMAGTSSPDLVNYNLYQAVASTPWGNSVGTNTVAATGDGSAQTHTVYATVLATEYINEPDTYSDLVTISVAY
ncbi:spore coat U domain-containing protein [Pusillimonas sp. ANT_WB101]|uniref:Csu type fimbrial protein n=1 Tax=Pusillimonas sp. ANT_WB101 TaxID=2597356 RepID=UPI00165E6EA3|nr:spore coat U domain-containing protein [Pusillimonas sp. ANT_WB101]